MRPWANVKRLLALVMAVFFVLGVMVTPVFAKSRSFSSGGSKSFSSGSRSYSTPKTTTPSTPSRSYSTPKPSTPAPSTPAPAPSTSTTPNRSFSSESKNYSSPSTPNYSSGSRNYSSDSRNYSSQRSTTPGSTTTVTPPPSYDLGRTKYPARPPVVIVGPSSYDPWYWHDWYYGRPWYWRMWHRPVYYGGSSWGISWVTVIAFGVGIWILLGIISAAAAKRRR